MLTDTINLPDYTNLMRVNLSTLVTVNRLLQVWQERGHPKARGDHPDAFVLAYWGIHSMEST